MTCPVTLIGFGEAGQAFAGSPGWQGETRAYDLLTDDPKTRAAKEADYRRTGVGGQPNIWGAVQGAELVLSLVTADQALAAARCVAGYLDPGALYCDLNSVSPGTKKLAAETIERVGGHYVDVAVMAPVHPSRLAVPLLLSGPEARSALRTLGNLGFSNVRVVGPQVGQASSIKMIRSVIVKGMEALTAEAMLAADAAGVTEEVLASLDASEKSGSWAARADYNLDRMIVHGFRRAEEMDEAVKTLQSLGIEPLMTRATAQLQRQIGASPLGHPAAPLAGKINQIKGRKADAA